MDETEYLCPICKSELELSDGFDGKFYVYCPVHGAIPELAKVVDFNDRVVLGYPPFLSDQGYIQ